MPFRQNVGGGVSAAKDTATEADVRYPKTFHSGKGTKAKVGGILDCLVKKITPGTNKIVIPKGSYIAENIEVDGDPALASANIKADISIFGVQGDPNVVDTSDGNLSAGRMLSGTKGYSKGKLINGEIQTLGDTSFSPSDSSAYNDCKISGATQNDYVGAFDYSITGYIAGKIRLHIANMLSKNIRAGVKVGGIGGYIEGSYTSDANALSEHILFGKRAGVKGYMVDGTMASVAAIDPAKSIALSSGMLYARMTRGAHITNASSGYPEVSIPQGTLANAIGLTASKLGFRKTALGITGTYKPTVKNIYATAIRGFGAPSDVYELSMEQSFTLPAPGTVYYSGFSASYRGEYGRSICEIYKNGIRIDHRNIDNDNTFFWRGTMHNQSFSAEAGDTIRVVANVPSGTHVMAEISAVIVYFP